MAIIRCANCGSPIGDEHSTDEEFCSDECAYEYEKAEARAKNRARARTTRDSELPWSY